MTVPLWPHPEPARNITPKLGAARAVLALVIPLLLFAAPAFAQPLFQSAFLVVDVGLGYGAAPAAFGISVADLNGDGRLDLVARNRQSNTVSVLLSNGDGTFAPRATYGTGSSPTSVAVGDLNGDGHLDLAVTNSDPSTVSVLLGNGDGSFGTKTDYATGVVPIFLTVADLNGDGRLDLATANFGYGFIPGSVSILLGNGDGSFGPKADLPGARYIAVGDLNGDGRPDLATAGGDRSVSVLLGYGDGTFGARTDYGTLTPSSSIAIGDVNEDGWLDLVAGGYPGVSVLLGNGDGTFGAPIPPIVIGTGSWRSPVSAFLADLNGDGHLDLAAPTDLHSVSVLLGNGDVSFFWKGRYDTDGFPFSDDRNPVGLVFGDLNGDGRLDIAATCPTGTVSILLGNGDGSFGTKVEYGTGNFDDTSEGSPNSVSIGDLNKDGRPDLAVVNGDYRSTTVSVLLGHGDGTFDPKTDYQTGISPSSIAMGDLNGDGLLDVVTTSGTSSTVSVLLGNGDGSLASKTDYGTGNFPSSVAIGDLNGDGRLDLVVANAGNYYVGSNTLSVLLGNGDGSFAARADYETDFSPNSVAIGDLNGDGRLDLATANLSRYPSFGTVSVLLGNGDGSFGTRADYPAANYPSSIAIGDLNGDGRLDLVVNSGTVLLGHGDGTFQATTSGGGGSLAIDLNGDGNLDMAAGSWPYNVSVVLGTGDGTFGARTIYGTGARTNSDGPVFHPVRVSVGDLNHDGRLDLVVANRDANVVTILLNIGPKSAIGVALDLEPNVINLKSHPPWVSAYIEPSGFDPASIELSTLRLAGSVPAAPKFATVGDHNLNGVPDLMVRFSRAALDPLLTPGQNKLEVTGSLVTGEKFKASDEIRVIGTLPGTRLSASIAPNPFNPAGVLTFRTMTPGRVVANVFDLQGRLVRTLVQEPAMPAGVHEVRIDEGEKPGQALASGVYFYRLETPDGTSSGRFAIMK